jgi:hypothetical protein
LIIFRYLIYLVPDPPWENHCCDDLAVDLRLETGVVPVL